MKKIMSFAVCAFAAASLLTSCATINSGAALSQAPIGQKVGEAKSNIILGLWSSGGEQNDIKKAAENGGITKINQVEYIDKCVFLGLFIEHTTRVYGE